MLAGPQENNVLSGQNPAKLPSKIRTKAASQIYASGSVQQESYLPPHLRYNAAKPVQPRKLDIWDELSTPEDEDNTSPKIHPDLANMNRLQECTKPVMKLNKLQDGKSLVGKMNGHHRHSFQYRIKTSPSTGGHLTTPPIAIRPNSSSIGDLTTLDTQIGAPSAPNRPATPRSPSTPRMRERDNSISNAPPVSRSPSTPKNSAKPRTPRSSFPDIPGSPGRSTRKDSPLNVGFVTTAQSHGRMPRMQLLSGSPRCDQFHPLRRSNTSPTPLLEFNDQLQINQPLPTSRLSHEPIPLYPISPSSASRPPAFPQGGVMGTIGKNSALERSQSQSNLDVQMETKRTSRFSEPGLNKFDPKRDSQPTSDVNKGHIPVDLNASSNRDSTPQRRTRFSDPGLNKGVAKGNQVSSKHHFKRSSQTLGRILGLKPKRMNILAEQDVRTLKTEYDRLALLSKHDLGVVKMEVLEEEWFNCGQTKSPAYCVPPQMVVKALRPIMSKTDGITFKRLLMTQYPDASQGEIQHWVDEFQPARTVENVEELPPDAGLVSDVDSMWARWDRDGNGKLDKEEFADAMRETCGVDDENEFEKLFLTIDTTHNGTVSKAEFLVWWIQYIHG